MASRTQLAKVVLAILAVAFVGLGVLAREPLWWWVTTKREEVEYRLGGHPVRGWRRVHRWTGQQLEAEIHYVENGFLAGRTHLTGRLHAAGWRFNGSVSMRSYRNERPPFEDVPDQTEPTAPWWKEGE